MLSKLSRVRAKKLSTPRQVKLVATALVIITLSVACLFAVSLFPNSLTALSGIVSEHARYIRATNAIAAAICAAFLLWPKEGSRLVGRWNEYVGWAFLILFIQYVVRLVALLVAASVQPEWEPAIILAANLVIYPASFFNNILFLMAARILLNKNKGLRGVRPPAGRAGTDQVKHQWNKLWAVLPRWVWLMLPLSLLGLFDSYMVWARSFDAFFSIYCLSWFGYAVRLNLQVRRRRTLAWLSFVLVLSYGAGQLIYALNPIIAQTAIDQSASLSSPARWMKDAFWPKVSEVVAQDFKPSDFTEPDELLNRLADPNAADALTVHLRDNPITHPFEKRAVNDAWPSRFKTSEKQEALAAELNAHLGTPLYEQARAGAAEFRPETRALLQQGPTSPEAKRRLNRLLLEDAFPQQIKRMAPVVDFLDGAIFALLFPMKYLLFLPAFILFLLSLVSVNDFRRALRKTTSVRKDYLSEDGILKVIGKSMDADEVKILIRIPGVMRQDGETEERCLAVSWSAEKKHANRGERKPFPIAKSNLLRQVMQTEGVEIILTDEDAGEDAAELRARGPSPQTLVVIPIKFHGGVIGAVWVILGGYGKYNDGTLEQLKFMAELVAPSVQDFRTMAAVDKFGLRLNRSQFKEIGKGQGSPHSPAADRDLSLSVNELVATLFDLLNPLCVGLLIECGFKTLRPAYPCDGDLNKILKEHRATYGPRRTSLVKTGKGQIRVLEEYLLGGAGKHDPLGKLLLVIPDDKDEFDKPTIAAYYLTRRMIASLIADGIINAARASFAVIIHDLGLALNKETLTYEQWFTEIGTAVRRAGLLWAVSSGPDGPQPTFGRLEYIEIVSSLNEEEKEVLQRDQLGCIVHKDPASATRHIIYLELDDTGRGLWLSVAREGFGAELSFNSPWREFLEQLAGISKAALKSIDDRLRNKAARQLEEEAKLKAAQAEAADEWIERNNLVSALTFHDLIDLVQAQRTTAQAALEAARRGSGETEGKILKFMSDLVNSTQTMGGMTSAIRDLTRWETPSHCSISDAARQAEQLALFKLRLKHIEVKQNIPPGAVANAPPGVVALVLANLLRNAARASKEGGVVTIHAEVINDAVSCSVLNNGTPISDEVREKLFERPLATTGQQNGWSLYVIQRLVKKLGGEVRLQYSTENGTCFTFHLPTAKS